MRRSMPKVQKIHKMNIRAKVARVHEWIWNKKDTKYKRLYQALDNPGIWDLKEK